MPTAYNPEKSVFLLGGHDLEMLEIKKILDLQRIKYFDEGLQWGAKLSAYKDKFDAVHKFIGVELIGDCEPPAGYTLIDHHNENHEKPSSIEQVAELLGIELNRYQQLVAANDKGYIPAMLEMGATKSEINDIRNADRKGQGVTDEDEKLARESIEEHQSRIGNVMVIKSLTPKFSAITDQLYPFNELLISYKNSFTYYGEKSSVFSKKFQDLIQEHKAYTGGEKLSFFGIDSQYLSDNESWKIYNEMLNLL